MSDNAKAGEEANQTVVVPQTNTVNVATRACAMLPRREILMLLSGPGSPVERSSRDVCAGVAGSFFTAAAGLYATGKLAADHPKVWIAWLFFGITLAVAIVGSALGTLFAWRIRSHRGDPAFADLMDEICTQLGIPSGTLGPKGK